MAHTGVLYVGSGGCGKTLSSLKDLAQQPKGTLRIVAAPTHEGRARLSAGPPRDFPERWKASLWGPEAQTIFLTVEMVTRAFEYLCGSRKEAPSVARPKTNRVWKALLSSRVRRTSIFVDEIFMVATGEFRRLKRALPSRCSVIFAGDPHQIDPVTGTHLLDDTSPDGFVEWIGSGFLAVRHLKQQHRFANDEGKIIAMQNALLEGRFEDFHHLTATNPTVNLFDVEGLFDQHGSAAKVLCATNETREGWNKALCSYSVKENPTRVTTVVTPPGFKEGERNGRDTLPAHLLSGAVHVVCAQVKAEPTEDNEEETARVLRIGEKLNLISADATTAIVELRDGKIFTVPLLGFAHEPSLRLDFASTIYSFQGYTCPYTVVLSENVRGGTVGIDLALVGVTRPTLSRLLVFTPRFKVSDGGDKLQRLTARMERLLTKPKQAAAAPLAKKRRTLPMV